MIRASIFEGVEQEPINIRHYRGKSPLFYHDFMMTLILFTARLDKLRAAMPTDKYYPLRVMPGLGLIAVHCFEYRQTDIGPYNEISISTPVHMKRRPFSSLACLLRSLLSNEFHGQVIHLPVTTEVALWGGLDYFGFPKYLAAIDLAEREESLSFTWKDGAGGELVLAGRVEKGLGQSPPVWSKRPKKAVFHSYPHKDGRILHARFALEANGWGIRIGKSGAELRLGSHPIAEDVVKLEIGRPLAHLYAPHCRGILYPPEVL